MKKRNVLFGSLLAMVVAFTGCAKDPISKLTEEESRIYIVNHDSTVNFSSYHTYSISDSVAVVNNGRATKAQTATDVSYINAVKSEMSAKGYQLVSRTSNPDLIVNVNRIYNTSTGVIRYDDYYDYYGDYWDPYYYGYSGYGYYSPYSYATYSISEGAMSVDLLDLKNAQTSNKIEVIWTGLIRGSGILNSSVANTQVQNLFNESSYFKTN